MRLSNLVPSLPQDLVTSLETIGVRTEMDLLFASSTLDIYNKLPAGTISLQELVHYTELTAELCAATGASFRDLLLMEDEARARCIELATGDEDVDIFLKGLGSGRIIELSGDSGSGKSTLAIHLLLHHLAGSPNHTGVYVDTTGDFSLEHASRIVDVKQLPKGILERFELTFAFELDSLQDLLDNFKQKENANTFMIVVDTITPLLGPLLSAVSAQGHACMMEFMRQLQDYAQIKKATVIIINNSAGQGPHTSERKPALGPSFALMSDTTLWLQKIPDQDGFSNVRSMNIIKSRSVAPRQALHIVLSGGAIRNMPAV